MLICGAMMGRCILYTILYNVNADSGEVIHRRTV